MNIAKMLSTPSQLVSVRKLKRHPRNPRKGDLEQIKETMNKIGFWGTIVAQKSTKHVLVGNHRYQAACDLGFKEVPVVFVDVDDSTAIKILLADNKTSDVASNDFESLVSLLEELPDLDGSGWSFDELNSMTDSLYSQVIEDGPFEYGESPYADSPEESEKDVVEDLVVVAEDEGEYAQEDSGDSFVDDDYETAADVVASESADTQVENPQDDIVYEESGVEDDGYYEIPDVAIVPQPPTSGGLASIRERVFVLSIEDDVQLTSCLEAIKDKHELLTDSEALMFLIQNQ